MAAMAAAVLSSCSKNEIAQSVSNTNAIGFESYTGITPEGLRGAPVETGTLQSDPEGFNVQARKHDDGASYFEQLAFKWNSTKNQYESTPAKYWPTTGGLDFLAYYDGTYTVKPTNFIGYTDDAKATYTIPTDAADQQDIVYAILKNQTSTDGASKPLTFKHALSRISVQAKSGADDVTVKVTGVTFNGLYTGSSSLTMGDVPDWKNVSSTNAEPITTTLATTSEVVCGTDYEVLLEDESNLMIVPQKLLDDAKLSIDYSIESGGVEVANITDAEVQLNTAASIPSEGLVAGKHYIIRLTISKGLNPITFTADVESWGEQYAEYTIQ